MKKIYQKPTTDIVELKYENPLLIASNQGVSTDDFSTGTILSREVGLPWDEE